MEESFKRYREKFLKLPPTKDSIITPLAWKYSNPTLSTPFLLRASPPPSFSTPLLRRTWYHILHKYYMLETSMPF